MRFRPNVKALYECLLLLWAFVGFSAPTFAADTAELKKQAYFEQLEKSFVDNRNWSFLPEEENAQPVAIKIGLGLVYQKIHSNSCCNGKYLFFTQLPRTTFDYKNSEELIAILLPPVGGLKSIKLNHVKVSVPWYDHLNGGIIVPLNKGLEKLDKISIEFEIDSPAVMASGFWHDHPIRVGDMSEMIKRRDLLLFHQKIVPLIVGTVAVLLAIFIFWIRLEIDYKTDQSFECIVMLFCWFLLCLFSSGLLRSIHPYFDYFHFPMWLLEIISIVRYLAVIGSVEKKIIRLGTMGCCILGSFQLIQLFFSRVSPVIYNFQDWIVLIFHLIVCIMLFISNYNINFYFRKIIRIFSIITAIGFLNDGIKLLLEDYGMHYPLMYFHRYTVSTFLFINVIYTIYDLSEKRTLKVKRAATEELALQIAHDVRSPLAALNAMDEQISVLPEEERVMFRSAINRIRDIANNLLERNRFIAKNGESDDSLTLASTPIEPKSVHLISSLLDQLITEKRIQYRSKIGIEIEACLAASTYGQFALVQAGEFKRVISNLINNAVEALGDTGRVTLSLSGGDANIQIKIQDNGKGIPEDVLPKLMKRGETYGKDAGSGLGLYHAKTTLERWQGSLALSSTVGVGTVVTITLPKAATPGWFVPSINLVEGSSVVVLDDDSSIHQIWQGRIDAVTGANTVPIIHCSTSREVEEWVARAAGLFKSVLYLFDHELLGDKKNGLDLIEALHLQKSAILVTSRYEEAVVRERCEKLGVRLIPKGMAGFVPISIQASTQVFGHAKRKKADVILLDDDKLVHLTWASIARKNQRSLVSFYRAEDFMSALTEFDTDTPIYIDSHLGGGVTGQTLIPQVKSHGFKTVYLATGYDRDQIVGMEGLTAVVGKDPASELCANS